ncbi:Exopolygalacturonase [Heracleum sosnowskyi]|uniref:Exopolygalacturonase n=1 Tax=Heracleum sosnowskyi TaxID=360622 RepID=A0AAD8HH20_9APIA|nr:Exopolygalacturonase [Heracleum sosnowskyi]
MATTTGMLVVVSQLVFLLICSCTAQDDSSARFFDVTKYGAVANGKGENSKQFLRAWEDACQWNGNSVMYIPKGIYRLKSVDFKGPCKSFTAVRIVGDLKASTDVSGNNWISFEYVDRLLVGGGGTVDGQGATVWGTKGRPRPISMVFNFVNIARISNLNFINSKSVHLKILSSQKVIMSGIRITAPENSPNTDGICISKSENIKLLHSNIASGDDCVSMLSGTENVEIVDVTCGPGHGISVGSLGHSRGDKRDNRVTGLHVRNCTFIGTQNGVRIKTWAPSDPGLVSNFVFEDLHMKNAENPIIIDQHYCPSRSCNTQAQSSIQIKNVTFRNIWGESSTPVAVKIQCSSKAPCSEFKLHNINLAYNGREGVAKSECLNVHGQSYGLTHPPGCL